MRSDGILIEKVKCSKFGRVLELPILFSFKSRKISDSELEATEFLPPGIEKLLAGKEILILERLNGGKFNIVKAFAREVIDGSCIFVLEGETSRDRRLFERFSFCPEDVGEFILQDGDKKFREAYIIDISLKGVKLFVKGVKEGSIDKEKSILLAQDGKIITVKILWEKEAGDGLLLGGEIVKTNFNLMKFVMDNYVSHVKKALYQST